MRIAEKIIMLRQREKMTQEELASRLEIHPQKVFNWEKEHDSPRDREIARLAKLFHVSYETLNNERITDLRKIEKPSLKTQGILYGVLTGLFIGHGIWVHIQDMTQVLMVSFTSFLGANLLIFLIIYVLFTENFTFLSRLDNKKVYDVPVFKKVLAQLLTVLLIESILFQVGYFIVYMFENELTLLPVFIINVLVIVLTCIMFNYHTRDSILINLRKDVDDDLL